MRSKYSTAISLLSVSLPPAAFLAQTDAMPPPKTSPPRQSAPAPHQTESRPHAGAHSPVYWPASDRPEERYRAQSKARHRQGRSNPRQRRSVQRQTRPKQRQLCPLLTERYSFVSLSSSFIASGLSPCRTAYSSANIWSNTIALVTPQQQRPAPVLPYPHQ